MLKARSLFPREKIAPVLLLFSAVFLSSCLPKEVENVTPVDASLTYEGFTGITAAETVSETRMMIKWNPSTSSKVVAYNIYDATFRFSPKLLKTVTAPASQVTLSGLSSQSLYSFRVRAADEENIEDTNTTDLPGIPYGGVVSSQVLSSTSAQINFTQGVDVDEVIVYCKQNANPTYERVATIRNLSLNSTIINDLVPGTLYTCRTAVSINGSEDNNTETTEFTPMGQAAELVFTSQPVNSPAGVNFTTQPVITIKDANGNVVAGGPDSTALITLTVATTSPTTGVVNGTVSVAAVAGVATFTDININEAGTKILKATKQDTSGTSFGTAEMEINSNSFVITPGAASPTNSTITISPAVPPAEPQVANGTDAYIVTFTLRDAFGNAISGIRPQFTSNVSGDTLIQPTQNTNVSGVVTGSISATVADTPPSVVRKIAISSPAGLSSVEIPAPFRHGSASKLAFVIQPSNSPAGVMSMSPMRVAIQDAQGNTINSGAQAVADITLSINANINGAVLSGTNPVSSVAGVSDFNGMGIDKTGNGYRLVASSGSLTPAYSNTFNVTAGVPLRIGITGPTNTLSGDCSTAVAIQLQDLGGNPANALQNTPVTISGLGATSMYTASNCSGLALSTNMIFTAGSNTRTVYLRNNTAQAITLTASDSSSVMTAGTLATTFSPSKIGILAQAASPAPPMTPLSVVAGACSTQIVITPMGEGGAPGPTFMPTTVAIPGISGSQAQLFSDASCTQLLNPLAIVLPINSGPDYTTKIYLKDPVVETLSISISDPAAIIDTTTTPQGVIVTPSNLFFSGPSSVVAGMCSSAFTVELHDTLGTASPAIADTPITINGVGAGTTGLFYTSASCTGLGSKTSVTFPQGATTLNVYFRSTAADIYDVHLSDPSAKMANSATLNIVVSPSALGIIRPVAGRSNTNICAGPFHVETLDSLGGVTNAVATINVNLSGAGQSGGFYSDSSCDNSITALQFTSGQNRQSFYYRGYFPETSLTFTASDVATVLSSATANWAVDASKAWIGTASVSESSGNLLWFRDNAKPVAALYDGISTVTSLAFDPTLQFLYVVDEGQHRILKYDYVNQSFVGWLGAFQRVGGISISGSNLTVPSPALCVSTAHNAITPGWCVGGRSIAGGNSVTTGRISTPKDVLDDGTYIYVASNGGHGVTRFVSQTGEAAGGIGWILNNTGMTAAPGGPATCATAGANVPTPGWCQGGATGWHGQTNPTTNDGRLNYPTSLAADGTYLYVLNGNAVTRHFKASGAFNGWIGRVSTTPTGGAANCTTTLAGAQTPGWCTGGASVHTAPMTVPIGGMSWPTRVAVKDNDLLVTHSNGTIIRYNKSTGAVIGTLPNLTFNWHGTSQMTTDGTDFYFADDRRIVRTDTNGLLTGWIGKVSNNSSMSGVAGCNSVAVNDNTPGWCLGGGARQGFDKASFRNAAAIAYDGGNYLLVGETAASGTVRRFNLTSGAYDGTLSLESVSPTNWSDNSILPTELNGFGDYDMFSPAGMTVDGDDLYLAERDAARVKKINRRTGDLIGWLGPITSRPTGGPNANCLTANPFTTSPGWCLGSRFLPSVNYVNENTNVQANGILRSPIGTAHDANYIYVADYALHRISRYHKATGEADGWIGRVATTPSGGAPGCTAAAPNSFTPGWCTGGQSTWGSGDGHLYYPTSLVVTSGNIYVVDRGNHRIVSYNSATGSFNGWIGRVGTPPTSGCITGTNGQYDVSTSGWCVGGTSQVSVRWSDRGGGFEFWGNEYSGLATDGTNLYIANFYNRRIDRYNLAGQYLGATRTVDTTYIDTWSTNPDVIQTFGAGCSYPMSIWTDGTFMYGTNHSPCGSDGTSMAVWKMNLTTGTMVGWQGGIAPGNLPFDGDSGCAGATEKTPGWCQGGATTSGLRMGQFTGNVGYVTGDSHFIYVSDITGNRVTRFPK